MRKNFILLLLLICCKLSAQEFAVKTNALYWATVTPNIGVEFGLSEKFTMSAMGGYNFMTYEDTSTKASSTKHWLAMLEARYWFCRKFERTFIGLNALYTDFSIAEVPIINKPKGEYWQGIGYGGGVTVGHHWAIGKRWGLELSAGVGVIFFDYDKYTVGDCNNLAGTSKPTYFGPTKLSLSFMYFFK